MSVGRSGAERESWLPSSHNPFFAETQVSEQTEAAAAVLCFLSSCLKNFRQPRGFLPPPSTLGWAVAEQGQQQHEQRRCFTRAVPAACCRIRHRCSGGIPRHLRAAPARRPDCRTASPAARAAAWLRRQVTTARSSGRYFKGEEVNLLRSGLRGIRNGRTRGLNLLEAVRPALAVKARWMSAQGRHGSVIKPAV